MTDDIIAVPRPLIDRPAPVVYKVYKRRWFVVLSISTGFFLVGLQKCILPIVDLYLIHMGVSIEQYTRLTQVGIFTYLIFGIYFARLLGRIGIRKMAYITCLSFLAGEVIQSLCYFNNDDIISVRKEYRFYLLALANVFIGISSTMLNNFPSKIAYSWFPPEESTRALVLSSLGYNAAAGVGTYLVPRIVHGSQNLHYLSYVFLTAPLIYSVLVVASLTRSKPKIAPSANVFMSARALNVPFKDGLFVLLTTSGFWLILLVFAINMSAMGSVQTVLEDILARNDYSEAFCGTIISSSSIFSVLFALISSTWLDMSANYVTYSRISSGLYGFLFCAFAYCVNQPNMEIQIVVLNLMADFANSLTVPGLIQVALRSSQGILPEPTVTSVLTFGCQTLAVILLNVQHPLKRLSVNGNGYKIMLGVVATMVLLVDLSYAVFFKIPDLNDLQAKLAIRLGRDQLVNEDQDDDDTSNLVSSDTNGDTDEDNGPAAAARNDRHHRDKKDT